MKITLIGGPTAVIEFAGLKFVTDPTFDPAGTDYHLGAVTLSKTSDPAVAPENITGVDAALLSHDQHPDNLDTGGRAFLRTVPQVFTTLSGAERIGANTRGLEVWETVRFKNIKITATPCRHGPAGIEPVTGDVIGFMLESDTECVYVTGDTVYYEGVAEAAKRFKPDAVVMFAGAAKTRGPFSLTMSADDALNTAAAFRDAVIIPVHTEGWAHFSQSADVLVEAFSALKTEHRLKVIRPGESFPM